MTDDNDNVVDLGAFRQKRDEQNGKNVFRHPSLHGAPKWMVSTMRPDRDNPEKWMRPLLTIVDAWSAHQAEAEGLRRFVEWHGPLPQGSITNTRRLEDGE